MAAQKSSFLNPEKALFLAFALMLGFLVWRAGFVDDALEAAGLPRARQPLPELPGDPMQRDVTVTEGYADPASRLAMAELPDFLATGTRNPFAEAYDTLKVVAAHVTTFAKITRSGGIAKVHVDYRILPHPVSEFEFRLPLGASLVNVYGSGVKPDYRTNKRDLGEDGTEYTVSLRSPVHKKYTLDLQVNWPRRAGTDIIQVPEIVLPNATHERGLIALAARPNLPVSLKSPTGVTLIEMEEIPAGLLDRNDYLAGFRTVAAFRYAAHPYSIGLDVSKRVATTKIDTGPIVVRRTDPPTPNPNTRTGPTVNPNTRTTDNTVIPTPAGPEWKLPVSFTGTLMVGSKRFALIKDKDETIFKMAKGDMVLGMTIVKVNPTSVILKNEKGQLFKFKDGLRSVNNY